MGKGTIISPIVLREREREREGRRNGRVGPGFNFIFFQIIQPGSDEFIRHVIAM